ncbi:MAG: DNA repair protein RadC [Cyclobacterium sp.]|nr:DNA repair protein RadC [Cyclobacterium sp.]
MISKWTVSEAHVTYQPPKNNFKVTGSQTANTIFQQIWDPESMHIQEKIYALFLNRANEVLCWRLMGSGTSSKCLIDNKLLGTIVCKTMASSVIIAHNHPSGQLKPSKGDRHMTWNTQKMLDLFDVELIDHLIITANGYYSFADNNLLSNSNHEF